MIYIGIDPDVDKSGVGIWNQTTKELECQLMTFWQLIVYLGILNKDNTKVIIESGWLNKKSNFHTRAGQSKTIGERIAKNVGANHQIGKLIESFCKENQINYELVTPRHSKVTSIMFFNYTGIATKNQEKIDAGMLVYGK